LKKIEDFRVLRFLCCLRERENKFTQIHTEIESVGSDCELCVFCLSVLSKTFAIQTKGTNKQSINDVGGAR